MSGLFYLKKPNCHRLFLSGLCAFVACLGLWCAAMAATPANTTTNNTDSQAFKQLLKQYFPLSPNQVHQFKNAASLEKQAAARAPGTAPANGTSSIIPITLKPGGIQPVVRVGQGMITSLVFIDANGQVWPIQSYTIGDPGAFNVQWDKKGGVLMVQGMKRFSHSNIGVILKGMNVPIMISLISGQKSWDYLDYIQVPQYQSGLSANSTTIAAAPNYLTELLNGTPPQTSTQMQVVGQANAQVWKFNNQYLLLTHDTLISPEYSARSNGPQGLHAYELQPVPEILLSQNGQLVRAVIQEPSTNG